MGTYIRWFILGLVSMGTHIRWFILGLVSMGTYIRLFILGLVSMGIQMVYHGTGQYAIVYPTTGQY
jgi:hypothetical protein